MISYTSRVITDKLAKIERRYDPENDAGIVTWIDIELVAMISLLLTKLDQQQEEINQLYSDFEHLKNGTMP